MITELTRMWLTRSTKPFLFKNEYDQELPFSDCDGLGLYVHIPFCRSICSFCPYCKTLYSEEACSRYIDALIREDPSGRKPGSRKKDRHQPVLRRRHSGPGGGPHKGDHRRHPGAFYHYPGHRDRTPSGKCNAPDPPCLKGGRGHKAQHRDPVLPGKVSEAPGPDRRGRGLAKSRPLPGPL